MAAAGTAAVLGAALPARAQPKNASGLTVERLAWAGIKLQLGKVTLFIDAVRPDPETGAPGPALKTSSELNFALATHHHGDHLDPEALKELLGGRGHLIVSEQSARLFGTRDITVLSARLYEPMFLSRSRAEFVAWAVPASDGLGSPQVSWVVDTAGRRIIHCGDTQWHGHFWDIGRAYGPFDVAFLPINGFRQTIGRFDPVHEPMSLTPEQAVDAAVALGARMIVPMHFGSTGNQAYIEEADLLSRLRSSARSAGIPANVLTPGEKLEL